MTSLADVAAGHDGPPPPDAAVRVVYQAVRALVAEEDAVTAGDLAAVTRLETRTAAAAMDRLARTGPLAVERLAATGEPAWTVARTDRW